MDKLKRCSRKGYSIFVNMAPIAWLSKKQATVEISVLVAEFSVLVAEFSVFVAEFVAMKLGLERIR